VIDYYFILDINECTNMTHNCDANARCNNTIGSHTCHCNEGYQGNGNNCDGI
jgi:hypothetical protein